jgi:hypothetical protein
MDRFFDGFSTQEEIFETVAKPILDSSLQGYAGLIMAYGPTGSGKTYAMRGPNGGGISGTGLSTDNNETGGFGNIEEQGIIPRYFCYLMILLLFFFLFL